MEEQWTNNIANLTGCSNTIYDWMTKPYVLSAALKRVCDTLSVEVIAQKITQARESEYLALQMPPSALPLVREIYLKGDEVPWVYCRVVIPPQTYERFATQFEQLGNNLLGETLLYDNPGVVRSAFEYGYFPKEHRFGRRSIFWMQSMPLLVTEIFLPAIPAFCLA